MGVGEEEELKISLRLLAWTTWMMVLIFPATGGLFVCFVLVVGWLEVCLGHATFEMLARHPKSDGE